MTTREAAKRSGYSYGGFLRRARQLGVSPRRRHKTGRRGRPAIVWGPHQLLDVALSKEKA